MNYIDRKQVKILISDMFIKGYFFPSDLHALNFNIIKVIK